MLREIEESPVTTILCIGALATFAAQQSGRTVEHLVAYPWLTTREPWRLVTSILPHGGILHLIFNLYWTWMLGRALELRVGPVRTLIFVLVAAAGSSAAQLSFGVPGIGLSGVGYGLVFFLYSQGKHDPKFSGVVDESLRNFFLTWFFICILLTHTGALPVANAAHGAGGLIGYFWGRRKRSWIGPAIAGAAVAAALLSYVFHWSDVYFPFQGAAGD